MMNLRIQRPFTSTPRRQEGSVSALMVIALSALALDIGHMMLNKTRLQNAVDAATLSGANSVSAANATLTAELNTLTQNAIATGNYELATAVGGNAGTFAVVELASSVYGPFDFPGPTDVKYVRVSVPSYSLTGLFWNFAQAFGLGGLGNKAVSAIATAGLSPASPCDLAPLMVCGDATKSSPFGFNVMEFVIVGLLVFTLLFGVVEMGRLYFTVNALDEAVRRGTRLAAVCNISDPVVLRRAIFNAAGNAGNSQLIGDLATTHLTLTYLDANGAQVANPADTVSGNGFRAIRYVQLSLQNFVFNLFIPGFGVPFTLPTFRATLPRESLGRHSDSGEITPC
ncbi:TadE-like protein [compost metagenome]